MPDIPAGRLEWTEENFSQVIADLYREAETDQALHAQLLAAPLDVLKSRIAVPNSYIGGIFAREKNQQTMMLYIPAVGQTRASAAEASGAGSSPDYEVICTMETIW